MNLPLNIDIRQILLHMLNFVILFGGLYFILYNPVKKFMAKREEKYKKDSENAERILSEAASAKEEYEKRLSDADKEIAEKKAAAEKELNAYSDRLRKSAQEEASAIVLAAKQQAEAERKEILDSAKKDICDIAAEAAEKIVYKDSKEAYDGFLDGIDGYDGQNN